MPGRRVMQIAAVSAAAMGISAYAFGGWATITVDDLPETVVAGRAHTLSFIVRQHGVTPLGGLSPSVTATNGRTEVAGVVTPGATGHYSSRVTFPAAGDWAITVRSGFMNAQIRLPSVRALAVGAAAPPALPPAERGKRLFVAKGCVTCHVHGATASLGYTSLAVGPELTPKRYEAAYLRRFLIDPSIARTPGRAEMPVLGLSNAELTSLVAFINADRSVAAARR